MRTGKTRLLLALLVGFGIGCPGSDDPSTDDAGMGGSDVAATGGTSAPHSGGSSGLGSGGTFGPPDSGGVTGTSIDGGVCSTGGAGGDNCGTTTCNIGQCCCRGDCISVSDSCP